jgi:hypothetical protein
VGEHARGERPGVEAGAVVVDAETVAAVVVLDHVGDASAADLDGVRAPPKFLVVTQ